MQTVTARSPSRNAPSALAALLSLVLFEPATIGNVHVERVSLLGYRLNHGEVLGREETIDALAELLTKVRRTLEDGAASLQRFGVKGRIHLAPQLSSLGPRVVVTVVLNSSPAAARQADHAIALGVVRDLLRAAGLDAQRDLESGRVVVYPAVVS